MKWLDLYPDILSSSCVSTPVANSSKVKLISDGPYADIPELPDELDSVPLYAWLLPARKIPQKYNDLFRKHGIPLLE